MSKTTLAKKRQNYENLLRDNLKRYLNDLKVDIFNRPSDIEDLICVEFFFQKLSDKDLMEHVIKHVLPHKEKIGKRDIDFFVKEKKNIFSGLPKEKVEYFEKRITLGEKNGGIKQESIDIMFKYFDVFLTLGEFHQESK